MKTLFSILFILLVAACHSNNEGSNPVNEAASIENAARTQDTLTVNGLQLVRRFKDERFLSLLTLSGDTIVKPEAYYFSIEFPDIDEDGYQDIRVFAMSNTPNQCDNYLFDNQHQRYRLIANSDLDIHLLKGTAVFYSYNRAGCSDLNWESHLSKIENWEEIPMGLILAHGCGDERDGIEIYKIKDGTKKLIANLPNRDFDNNSSNNKWQFIQDYWTHHHAIFEQ